MAVDRTIRLTDTVTKLDSSHAAKVVVSGSHGGIYSSYLTARAQIRAVILNDAGVGKDEAGIAGLVYLDDLGMAAATVGNWTARIGDASDMWARGVINYVNKAAAELGCSLGESCAECAARLKAAIIPRQPKLEIEFRNLIQANPGEPEVWTLDSVSLVQPGDYGNISITGSHGALLGGRPETSIKVDVLAAVYNDAGGGIDGAGFSRLPALDARGIAAATVAADSARIGDGRSTWEEGILSCINRVASEAGITIGMTTRDFVARIIKRGTPRKGTSNG